MPLIHSKRPAAFKKNIETEMEHGKPQKQAVAIAYRMAGEHKAEGGEVGEHHKEPEKEESGEDDMSHSLAKELIGAMDKKDHKGVSAAVEAMVMHHMTKGGDDV